MALMLTRREGEIICIGDDIFITVTKIRGSEVKLAIEAPPDIKVYRKEIFIRIKEEGLQKPDTTDENIGNKL
jgi:carbon storage regulator